MTNQFTGEPSTEQLLAALNAYDEEDRIQAGIGSREHAPSIDFWSYESRAKMRAALAVAGVSAPMIDEAALAEVISDFNACGACADAPPHCRACAGEARAIAEYLTGGAK